MPPPKSPHIGVYGEAAAAAAAAADAAAAAAAVAAATAPCLSTKAVNIDTEGKTILYRAIERRDWRSAVSRVRHCPSEASIWLYKLDDAGQVRWRVLPLHQACSREPPAHVVRDLIAAYPEAVSARYDAGDGKTVGNLAIHYALQWHASLDVVKMLLSAYPEALEVRDSRGLLPEDIARAIVTAQAGGDVHGDDQTNEVLKLLHDASEAKKAGVGIASFFSDGKADSKEDYMRSRMTMLPGSAQNLAAAAMASTAAEATPEEEAPKDEFSQAELGWMQDSLVIVVVGASGDLAKKKTYPSLLNLFDANLLPPDTVIYGFARSAMTQKDLQDRLRPFLQKSGDHDDAVIEAFLDICQYKAGKSYGDVDAFAELAEEMKKHEDSIPTKPSYDRLFYFALPPNVFAETGAAIKKTCMSDRGWSRLIVEKPFGRDLASCEELLGQLAEHYTEDQIYRIDHYLGKEMVQNLLTLRFGNLWFERLWNRNDVQCVIVTFKEPFGTEGRGGYFDKYGIIRDIIQNHLLQVLTLLAMEPPIKADGPEAGERVRDAKVSVLKAIPPVTLDEVLLGQYEGYSDDPTIMDKDTNCPTFAAIRCFIRTPRWDGVPFIFKAAKAMDERKAEVRIQFKDAPAASFMFDSAPCPRNELIIRLQPKESIYLKTNVKSPGFGSTPIQSELEVNYDNRYYDRMLSLNPDAYTRLILDVIRGRNANFVRDDELRRAWEIFTPILHRIENEKIKPIMYKRGTRGPPQADDWVNAKSGYVRNKDYVFHDSKIVRKTKASNVPSGTCDIGLWGLAIMGQNFALNMAEHGFSVCVGNRSPGKVDDTVKRADKEGIKTLVGAKDAEAFVRKLKRPRKVVILVQAGKPVDSTIETLSKYMDKGDLIIDGGNEWYENSLRRSEQLSEKGIMFMGMGISGGEEGARNGPSLMPGGPKEAYDLVEKVLTSCAAMVKDGACATYIGPVGSGNYVKMVHNGIEYGDMQLIGEVYDVMKHVLGMTNEEMAAVFEKWNLGQLSSYLIEITAKILAKKDDVTGKGYVVDYVMDKTGSKGTGRWTVQEAAEQSVAAPTMAASLDARYISARKEERVSASKILKGPAVVKPEDKNQLLEDLRKALYASKVCSYAQGLGLIKAASDKMEWDVNLSECARIWKGGCIIRAELLNKIQDAFTANSSLENLMVDPGFAAELNACAPSWRRVIITCFDSGITCPSLCASLTYFDSYRRAELPANLTQAQRDFFGGHTYERTDAEGPHHTAWTDAHKNIGDISQRTAGETVAV